MKCPNCQTELQKNAKFCIECGSKVEQTQTVICVECGVQLKEGARFCQNCGAAVNMPSMAAQEEPAAEGARTQSWLHSFGAFLLIPIFAGIVVLLFWVNKDPEPVSASNPSNAEQPVPDMAAMQNVHQTLERLKQNLESNPQDVVSMDSLAIMYSIAGNFEKALEFYERHLEIEPDNKELKIALGFTYHKLNRNEEAISAIQEVLDAEPSNFFALHYLAEIHSTLHNHEQATALWTKIINTYPGTEWAKMAEQRIRETTHPEESN